MTFLTGAINNANPGPALYAVIETAALALGWTLEDTVTPGATHKVLKSAAAGNARNLDWFLDINYPATGITNGIRFAPFESYIAASDTAVRAPHVSTSTVIDATTHSRYGAAGSLLESANWTIGPNSTGMSLTLSTSFTYYISITRNRIIVLLTSDPTNMAYTGFFLPSAAHIAHAGSALFPLIQTRIPATGAPSASSNGTLTSMATTRAPTLTTFPSGMSWGNLLGVMPDYASAEGIPGTGVSPFTGRIALAPMRVLFGNSTASASQGLSSRVGLLEDVGIAQAAGTVTRGDTLTIGSDTWYTTGISGVTSVYMRGV